MLKILPLSEAIILGDTLKKCDPQTWISEDGSCGCALGGALLATGVTAEEFNTEWTLHTMPKMPCIMSRWPWLTWEMVRVISSLYINVAHGEGTIYDVAAYVRSVEPAAQSSTNCLDTREAVEIA